MCCFQLAGSLFPVEGVLIANMQNNLYGTDVDKVTPCSFLLFLLLAVARQSNMETLVWVAHTKAETERSS